MSPEIARSIKLKLIGSVIGAALAILWFLWHWDML
jgi:hypothetical protein